MLVHVERKHVWVPTRDLLTAAFRSFSTCFSGVKGFLSFLSNNSEGYLETSAGPYKSGLLGIRRAEVLPCNFPCFRVKEADGIQVVCKLAKLFSQKFLRAGFVDSPSKLQLGSHRVHPMGNFCQPGDG